MINPGYVVVMFGSAADEWCTLNHCPMGTVEWFPSQDEARAYCETLPSWMQPHVLSVSREHAPDWLRERS